MRQTGYRLPGRGVPQARGARWGAAGGHAPCHGAGWPRGSYRLCRRVCVPLSADPLGSAQATAAELSQEVIDEAVVVHDLSMRYESDRAQANFLGAEVGSSQATVESIRLHAERTEAQLRQEALFSYTDEVPAASTAAEFAGSLVEVAARKGRTCR